MICLSHHWCALRSPRPVHSVSQEPTRVCQERLWQETDLFSSVQSLPQTLRKHGRHYHSCVANGILVVLTRHGHLFR